MKATIEQLQRIETLEKDFLIKLDLSDGYGFNSMGNIGVNYNDKFGYSSLTIDKQGQIISN